jgi:hypothetical protein
MRKDTDQRAADETDNPPIQKHASLTLIIGNKEQQGDWNKQTVPRSIEYPYSSCLEKKKGKLEEGLTETSLP